VPVPDGMAGIHVLRTLDDCLALRAELDASPGRVVVVGAGFIGQEVAATARSLGAEVTIVEAADAPLAAVVGAGVGQWFAELHRDEGVRVLLSTTVTRFRGTDSVEAIELSDGRRLSCDAVVVGIGVSPATGWAGSAGFPATGIPVGPGGRTFLPHVFAAGDAAMPFDERLGTHVRSEHWESAARGGAEAARAMLGLELRPAPLSSFWSDQYGVRIQYVGRAQGADRVEVDGSPAERDFAAVYSCDGAPIGALLVGRPHELPALRRLIESGRPGCPELVAS
jgi:3-phenylpropionate/trans-cinnamate dioxygenase ferredoxin reductase component